MPPPATWITPEPLITAVDPTFKTLSQPVPIFKAVSVPVDPVILLMFTPFNVPAPTPVAAIFKPLDVPPVVMEEEVLH